MHASRSSLAIALAGGVFGAASTAAQAPDEPPPFVPTPMPVVVEMLALARVTADDVLYDLGSGDGRIVIEAARRHGARGVGYEIEPALVERSNALAAAAGVDSLVEFVGNDLFTAELRAASVVTLYLSPRMNLELRPKLLAELAPGARIVSHAFHMGDWRPDTVVHVGEGLAEAVVYLWTVPADVDGFWQLVMQTRRGERQLVLELDQRFQQLGGQALRAGNTVAQLDGRMRGDRVEFALREGRGRRAAVHRFTGRRIGGTLEGTVTSGEGGARYHWRATRFTP